MKLQNILGIPALLLAVATGCADTDESWERSLPLGDYTLTAPVCLSTGEAPDYPDVRYKAALFDFDGTTSRTLSLEAPLKATETFQMEGCTLTVEREVAKNFDGYFSLKLARTYHFDPAGCRPSVTVGDSRVLVGPEFSTLFENSDDKGEDLLYEVSEKDGNYSLTSIDLESVNGTWHEYGCKAPDRLRLGASPYPRTQKDG